MLCLRKPVKWELSNLASFGPLGCVGRLKEELRLGTIIGSSSVEDSYGEESYPSNKEEERIVLFGDGARPTTIVSVRAFPLESIVKITSVRGPGWGDSGIDRRFPGR